MSLTLDADFLGAALVGYQEMLKQIESRMADLRHRLHVAASAPSTVAVARATKKRIFSVGGARPYRCRAEEEMGGYQEGQASGDRASRTEAGRQGGASEACRAQGPGQGATKTGG